MDRSKILLGVSEEDVVTFTDKSTFCVSQFRDIVFAAISDIQNRYAESLKSKDFLLQQDFLKR